MGEEEPEAENWLGKDVENGVSDDLSIKTNKAATVSNTPDAVMELVLYTKQVQWDTHIG